MHMVYTKNVSTVKFKILVMELILGPLYLQLYSSESEMDLNVVTFRSFVLLSDFCRIIVFSTFGSSDDSSCDVSCAESESFCES